MSSIDRPSQGVKTLKNNAINIMKIIILMGRVEIRGADQPTHPRGLISAFIVRSLESIINKLATRIISAFQLIAVTEQVGLSLAWSETQKTGLLALKPR